MLSPSKKFNKIQLPVSQFAGSELYTQAVGGRILRISSDREDQMRQKLKAKKKSLALQTKPKKIPAMPNFQAIKVYSRNYAGAICGNCHESCFEYTKKYTYLNETTQKYT